MTQPNRDEAIDRFFGSLSRSRLEKIAVVNRRGRDFKITVRHDVGFGGSRIFTIRADSKAAALDCLHKSLSSASSAPSVVNSSSRSDQ